MEDELEERKRRIKLEERKSGRGVEENHKEKEKREMRNRLQYQQQI